MVVALDDDESGDRGGPPSSPSQRTLVWNITLTAPHIVDSARVPDNLLADASPDMTCGPLQPGKSPASKSPRASLAQPETRSLPIGAPAASPGFDWQSRTPTPEFSRRSRRTCPVLHGNSAPPASRRT